MSIFGRIADAIFGGAAHAAEAVPQAAQPAAATAAPTASSAASSAAAASAPSSPAATPKPAAKMTNVDVAAVLDKLDETSDEDLDWRVSIVDLMKLLKLDSSLKARKELAKELNYGGDMGDSAKMNVWLHKQVMTKLAANGGKLPPEIKH